MKLLEVIFSFLKIGAIGFGGGSALIPVVEKEIVENKKWIGSEEYNISTIVSNITPGALPVKLGALWNGKFSLISAFGVALPGTVMLLIIMTVLSLAAGIVEYIKLASVGITAFIMLLLFLYIFKVHKDGQSQGVLNIYIFASAISFLLKFGKDIRNTAAVLFNAQNMPPALFAISTIDLMIIAFFVICFTGISKSKIRVSAALVIAGMYALSVGNAGVFKEYSLYLKILMLFMVIAGIVFDRLKNKEGKKSFKINLKPAVNIAWFMLIPLIMVMALFFFPQNGEFSKIRDYAGNVAVSTVTSFGGGEAYVGVADGFFVQTGLIDSDVYYNRVVAVANALPGPILVKISAAIGYFLGVETGGIGFGWLTALLGLTVSVGVSGIGGLIVYMCFDFLKEHPLLYQIKKFILPVVCGMLLSTILAMLNEALKILAVDCGLNPFVGLAFLTGVFLLSLFLHKKYRLGDLILLLINGGVTLLICLLIRG